MIPLTSDTFLVDNSMLEFITTCPYLAYQSIVRRRRPAGDSPPLRFGAFIHNALAYRYANEHDSELDHPIERRMLDILSDNFRATPCELEGWRSYDNAVKVIRAYNTFYPKEDFFVAENVATHAPYVEQPFAVDTHQIIRGRRIIYTGKIDLKVVFPDHTKYTLDHKTSSVLGDTFWSDQQMTGQHRGYVWADRECTGEECTGYIVNALGCKESLANAVFDENLGQLIPGLTNSGRASKATPVEFARQRFFTAVPPGQIDEWYENMLAQVDMFLYCVEKNSFPRHTRHCIYKYGPCQFYNVCSLPKESRENALMSGAYAENTWTPLY